MIPSGVALSSSLATVAVTGSYSDLLNAPTIPSATSQLTNNSGFITNTIQNIFLNGASGTLRGDYIETAGSKRWFTGSMANAESGGNAGSDFNIVRYDDTGTLVDAPFSIARSSGKTSFSQTPYVGINNIWHAGNFNPSNYALIGSGATFGGAISSPSVTITGANQTVRPIYFQTSGINRWSLYASSDVELGSTTGSTLFLDAYSDNGNQIGNVFSVTRSTQTFNFANSPTVDGIQLVGVPVGGSSSQVLQKNSGTNFDVSWASPQSGLPTVTTADNGDTLMVVAGVWTKYATPWQGPIQSSWNTPIS